MASTDTTRPSVLFACRANAGRSVTAKVLAEHYARGRIDVSSAGSEPGTDVHPEIAFVLAERGLSTAAEHPKPFDETATYDVVITMGCGDTCPIFPGKRYEDWTLDDPAGHGVAAVRPIRDEIRARVTALVDSLAPHEPKRLGVGEQPLGTGCLSGEGDTVLGPTRS